MKSVLFRVMVVMFAVVSLFPAALQAQPRPMGNNIEVGSFRLFVQIQQRRVDVIPLQGTLGALVPVTALDASFESWDSLSRRASIQVAVRNTGSFALFTPIRAVVRRFSSPDTRVVNADTGTAIGTWTWNYLGDPLGPGSTTFPRSWIFFSPSAADFQVDVTLLAGVPVPAGRGATITAPDGSRIVVPPNAVPYDALVDIEMVPASELAAPLKNLGLAGVVHVTFEPTVFSATFPAPSQSFQISIPAITTAGTIYVVAEQVTIDAITSSRTAASPTPQLFPVSTAVAVGPRIATAPPPPGTTLIGVKDDGIYAFVKAGSSTGLFGWAIGEVRSGGVPRGGVVVSNSTNPFIAITDALGRYDLFVNGGPFTLFAFDPFLGQTGFNFGVISSQGGTAFVAINLINHPVPLSTRPGIRNGGWERRDLTSWHSLGATVRQTLFTSVNWQVRPSEGDWMADLTTGVGSFGTGGALLEQAITVPAGAKVLKMDVNFVSEEFPERVGAPTNDLFHAKIQTPEGDVVLANVTVSTLPMQAIGDCFTGGDTTCGETGWQTVSIDLSPYAGSDSEITIFFSLSPDASDSPERLESHLYIDNVRFNTLWLDYNIVVQSGGNLAAMKQSIVDANELLSQAGINARLRGFVLLQADPNFLDVYCNAQAFFDELVVRATMRNVLEQSRSPYPWDLHVYRIRSITGLSASALAVGPDDYYGLEDYPTYEPIDNAIWGILTTDDWGDSLAHEIGHMIISPNEASSSIEHHVTDPANFMKSAPTVTRTVVSAQQSSVMNKSIYLEQ
jgi:hypothetical protein